MRREAGLGIGRVAAQRHDVAHARVAQVVEDVDQFVAAVSHAGQVRGGVEARLFLQPDDDVEVDFRFRGSVEVGAEFRQLAPGTEGGITRHLPDGAEMPIFDAAMKYKQEGVPLVVIAGSEYGTGSSRDWAAKGTFLLGVRAVLAASYERIHRSNLVGMGVLPLEFEPGVTWQSLGLSGEEVFEIPELNDQLKPSQKLSVIAQHPGEENTQKEFTMRVRIDTPVELEYYRNGGILQTVLRKLLKG